MVLTAVSTSAAQAAPSPTTAQLSVTTGGFASDLGSNSGSQDTERRFMSADGRYVVFESSGPIVQGQEQLEWQVVLRDRHLGTTTLLSKSPTGGRANGRSFHPSISADGKRVAFHSYASNLVAGDTNAKSDIFVHDVRTGKNTRISVTSAGAQVTSASGTNMVGPPSISADGRYVGFTSVATGLAPGDDPILTNAYLHDLDTHTTEIVSRAHSGAAILAMPSSAVSVSANGTVVAFHSMHGNNPPGIFVRDRTAASTVKLPTGTVRADRHSMTPSGRFIVYESAATTLVPGDTNAKQDVFVYDRTAQTTQRVSVGTGGTQGNGESRIASISNDGNRIAFISEATNLVSGDTNGQADAFLHDRSTNQTTRVSVANSGAQNTLASRSPAISGDGKHVVFESHGSALTPVKSHGYGQVFVRDLTGKYPALKASVVALPARVAPGAKYRITTRDIRTGPALTITWAPVGGGAVIHQSAAVSGNAFVLRSPSRGGKYAVTVTYAGNKVGGRTIVAIKPSAKALPKVVKAGKKLTVKTTGLAKGQKIQVSFKPKGKGKTVKRAGKVNQAGIAKVKTAKRGLYKVTVRANGATLRKATIRIR